MRFVVVLSSRHGVWEQPPQFVFDVDAEALPDHCCEAAVIDHVHVFGDGRVTVDVCPQHAVTGHVVAHLLQHYDVEAVVQHHGLQVLEQCGLQVCFLSI
jgi:hypothetical protein